MKAKIIDKSFILIVVIIIFSGASSWYFFFKKYNQQDTVDINQFPKVVGNWKSEELPISEEDFRILETRNAFARRYFKETGEEILLLIVYSQNNRKVSHPPEVCYTGGGATIISRDFLTIPLKAIRRKKNDEANAEPSLPPQTITSNKVLFETNNYQQMVYYWFKVGDSFTPNYWKQQILIALKTLVNRPASSALIRLSIVIEEGKDNLADQSAIHFSQEVVPLLYQYLP